MSSGPSAVGDLNDRTYYPVPEESGDNSDWVEGKELDPARIADEADCECCKQEKRGCNQRDPLAASALQ
jgi:hypothetical protein